MAGSSKAYVTCKSGGQAYPCRFTGVTSIEHNLALNLDSEASQGTDIVNGAPVVLPVGVTMNDNSNGTVTVTPSGTRQDLLLTAGIRVMICLNYAVVSFYRNMV